MTFQPDPWPQWLKTTGREQRIKDYIHTTMRLIWQRQAIFLAATLLSAFYFDPVRTFACYSGVLFSEVLDMLLIPAVRRWRVGDETAGRIILMRIIFNTLVSAGTISLFIVNIAQQQPVGGHFTPLFLLFAASLFAAMNNNQMIGILMLRLSIYGVSFIYIGLFDIVRYRPPLSSNSWLEFFTIVFVLYFIVDISLVFYGNYQVRLRQLRTIREENERTKAAYQVKSQFLSTVSHELRTPLTSIKASLDLVQTGMLGEVPDSLRPALTIAAKNSQRLADLIDDLLDLQKIEAGEMTFRFETVEVGQLVKDAIEGTRSYGDQLGIHITMVLPKDEVRIRGDQQRLMQVMNNLLSNALKFSHEGGTVQVRVEPRGQKVRICVQDEGIGIPKGSHERVFGKFSQVDSSDIRKVGGTGLGMNITKQIVEHHEGRVDYESELGHGSTFYVELNMLPHGTEVGPESEPMAVSA
ncbi:MAG: two-component sensor histidine kinase [Rhodobacterales bacterium]|nr:MAG: two-component sensor histidine kinase [Rhodobacterales bacterium]